MIGQPAATILGAFTCKHRHRFCCRISSLTLFTLAVPVINGLLMRKAEINDSSD
jgi:hypothetical protein